MSDEEFIALEAGSSFTRNEKGKKDRVNTTLFISSLPYNATTTDLITHFSFIGPVRFGFIATDKDSGKSKGVGYVTYSLEEDAKRAVAELDGGEFGDKGRKIRVTMADKKPPPPPRGERAEESTRPTVTAITSISTSSEAPPAAINADPKAIQTLILSGLPAGITKQVLWKRVRKVNEHVELVFPIEGEEDAAHLVFPNHGDALRALPKLHGHTYKGVLLSCVLKKRADKLSAKGEGKSPSHAGRLIVRNLSWDTTAQDLRATFLPYGPIQSIDLPTLPSLLPPSHDPAKPNPPPRARGFAFVWFLVRKDAERAMEGVNGKVIKKIGAEKKKDEDKKEGRPVAVDWALSKEKWKETQGEKEEKKAEASGSEDEDEESGSGSDSEDDGEGDENDDDEDAEKEEDADGDVAMEEPVKPQLPAVEAGSTLFIRNLPFEATEQELGTLFLTFGPLRYAKVTMDKTTGRSRGSGFVCFWKTDSADRAMLEAEKVAHETGAGSNSIPLGGKSNPFALPSILTADPSSSLASRLVLHGRTLEVSRAVTREEAGQMKEDGERAREKGDKRNTYLMREGVVFPNSPAAADLPAAEIEKRQSSFAARKALLKSNPSLYISKTRLSIRQLPLFCTDRTLKRLAIHAVRAFDEEVTKEEREALTRAEETDETLSPGLLERGKGKKKGERVTPVIQSKVVRQSEKLDVLTGMGKSKGYGFLEMRSHTEALKMLRWANNNADVGGLMWSWWKEEMAEWVERTKKALEEARERERGQKKKADKREEEEGEPKPVAKKEGEKKEKESVEDLEGRLRKLDNRLAEGDDRSQGGMRGGKTLLVEFSVENVQVVKRRVEKVVTPRTFEPREARGASGTKRKAGQIEAVDSDAEDGEKPAKKAKSKSKGKKERLKEKERDAREGKVKEKKVDPVGKADKADKENVEKPQGKPEKRGLEKMGDKLGSLIGRKRKARKGK
ncbi:nucleolar protein 4, partial [Tremellales sp. Uapishka_1]